jgi:hypothetical protein
MTKKQKLEKIKELLTKVVNKELEASKAIDAWIEIDRDDKFLKECWFHLTYYSHDKDIRERDKEYAEAQIKQLQDDIKEIEVMIKSEE